MGNVGDDISVNADTNQGLGVEFCLLNIAIGS